jgi:hypothetical protein
MSAEFTITREWIEAHRTPRGGWTRLQIEALGEPWPPPHGWRRRAVGRQITDRSRAQFELALRSRQARADATLDLFR